MMSDKLLPLVGTDRPYPMIPIHEFSGKIHLRRRRAIASNASFAWFSFSWFIVFPIACGMGIGSLAFVSGLSGVGKDGVPIKTRVELHDPELLFASVALLILVCIATYRYVTWSVSRRARDRTIGCG